MMRKINVIVMALFLSFLLVPVGYTCLVGDLEGVSSEHAFANSPPHYEVVFTSVRTFDNERCLPEPKDVADTNAGITDAGKKIIVTIDNAYPGYKGYVIFTIKNKSTVPIRLVSVDVENPNPTELKVRATEGKLEGVVLGPGCCVRGGVKIVTKQPAAQDTAYTFSISILAVQA